MLSSLGRPSALALAPARSGLHCAAPWLSLVPARLGLQHQAAAAATAPLWRQSLPAFVCAAGLEIGRKAHSAAAKPAASFEELQLMPSLLEAMRAAGLSKPTDIQAMAVPAILAGGDHLLASQTGSGKTLAYLLPLVQLLKAREVDAGGDSAEAVQRRPKRPAIIVLGPTKELTEQITAVAKSLCHHAKFRAVCCNANSSLSQQAAKLSGPVDVVVATPTRLLQHQQAGKVALGDVRWLVVDEADTMFDQGFGPEVNQLLTVLKAKPAPAQVVLVSATMTKAVKRLAEAQLPGLVRLEAAGFHMPTAGARQEFRVLPPGGDKMELLMELLGADAARRRRVLVFCGSVDSCRAVEHVTAERGLPAVCYHGDMPVAARKESMAAFTGAAGGDDVSGGGPTILVASDLAARGLDFPGSIDHVINFDFPSNAIDYLHRAGRTARAGASGRVTSLVGPRDRRLATAIQYALDKGIPLDQVTASGAAQAEAPVAGKAKAASKAAPGSKAAAPAGRWKPEHKFLHMRDGQPIVPFAQLLKGKSGDERKRLLAEIAADVEEWRRQRARRANEAAARRREKQERDREKQALKRTAARGSGGATPDTPQARWQQKADEKRQQRQGGGGGGTGRVQQQQRRGRQAPGRR